jgi:hypothetical protein
VKGQLSTTTGTAPLRFAPLRLGAWLPAPSLQGWAKHGGNRRLAINFPSYSFPDQVGPKASALPRLLEAGYQNVALGLEDWHRLTIWLDLNRNFCGGYHDPSAQARGDLVGPISP